MSEDVELSWLLDNCRVVGKEMVQRWCMSDEFRALSGPEKGAAIAADVGYKSDEPDAKQWLIGLEAHMRKQSE